MNAEFDVVVLGAGAAGLMCAMTAAARRRRVLLLERAEKVGKKSSDIGRRTLQLH